MTKTKEFKTDIIDNIFNIDSEIAVSEEELDYLFSLEEKILESFEANGETGTEKIRGEVLDDLLKHNFEDLIKYLGLEIPQAVKDSIDKRFADESLFTIEETEKSDDFFNNYLIDDVINDIIYTLLGFDRKSDGTKEVFKKKRKAMIPTARIMSIKNILIAIFNKTNFLSKKDDVEQAKIIMMAYKSVAGIILEISYPLCDTQKTMEICDMTALKLSNLIGLSEGYRTEFLETVKESLSSDRKIRDRENRNRDDD